MAPVSPTTKLIGYSNNFIDIYLKLQLSALLILKASKQTSIWSQYDWINYINICYRKLLNQEKSYEMMMTIQNKIKYCILKFMFMILIVFRPVEKALLSLTAHNCNISI